MNDYLSSGTTTLDVYAERLRVQLPVAPEGLLSFYVRWWPWLAIVGGALLLFVSGIASLLSVLAVLVTLGTHIGLLVSSVFSIVASILSIVGGYLMLKMRLTGWWILAAGFAINILSSLFGGPGAILSVVITLLIAYVHLEVKPRYS